MPGRVYTATRHSRLLAACIPQDLVSHLIFPMDPTYHRIAHSALMRDIQCSASGMSNRRLMMRVNRPGRLIDRHIGDDLGLACIMEFREPFKRLLNAENVTHYFYEVARHAVLAAEHLEGSWYLREMLLFVRRHMSPISAVDFRFDYFPWPRDVLSACGISGASLASLAAFCGDAELCQYFKGLQGSHDRQGPQSILCFFLLVRAGLSVRCESAVLRRALDRYAARRGMEIGGFES